MGSSLNKLPPILHKPCFSDGITPRLPAKPVYRHTPSNPAACQPRRDHPLHPSSGLAVEEHRDRAAPATPACLAMLAAWRQEPSHWLSPKTFAIQASPSPVDLGKAWKPERAIPARSLADPEARSQLAATCPGPCSPPPPQDKRVLFGVCAGCGSVTPLCERQLSVPTGSPAAAGCGRQKALFVLEKVSGTRRAGS